MQGRAYLFTRKIVNSLELYVPKLPVVASAAINLMHPIPRQLQFDSVHRMQIHASVPDSINRLVPKGITVLNRLCSSLTFSLLVSRIWFSGLCIMLMFFISTHIKKSLLCNVIHLHELTLS